MARDFSRVPTAQGVELSLEGHEHENIVTLERHSRLATDAPSAYPYGLSVMEADGSEGSWGWQVGIVHTTRILDTAANGYADADGAMQTLFVFAFNTLKRRHWRPDVAEWSEWKPEADPTILAFNYVTGSSNLGVYPPGVSVLSVSDDQPGWPTTSDPAHYYLVVTFYAGSVAYQYAYYGDYTYGRYWDPLDSVWDEWKLLDPEDAAAGVPSLRSLGTGATQACAGNDARLSNARTPTAHASTHTSGADDIQNATSAQKGLATAAQITKLNAVEDGATADQTATEIRDALLTVDGSGSGVDADKLDGQEASAFLTSVPDAATGTKGVTKLSVAPVSGANPIAAGDNDSRLSDTRTPTDNSVTNAKVSGSAAIDESKLNLASDAVAATASRRTLGTGAQQAAAGNDSRLSDTRTPTDNSVTNAKVGGAAAIDESKLNLASDAVAATASRRTLGTGAQQAAAGNDSRLSDTRTPTDSSVTNAKVDAAAAIAESKLNLASDAVVGTASRRTLGTGAQQAAAGNDSRLSDQRTPSDDSVTNAKVAAAAAIAESKLNLASDAAAATASRRTLGTGATQACAGNDSRLSDARTPTQATESAVGGGEIATQAEADAETDDTRFLTPLKAAARSATHRQYDTAAGAVTVEGDTRYESTRKHFAIHDGVRERALMSDGFMPYAFPIGGSPTQASSASVSMGISGGANAIPIVLEAHMLLQSVSVWTTDTTQTRGPLEFGIYEDRLGNSNTLDLVTGAVGSLAAVAATVAARRDVPVTTPPVYLAPGLYWLVLKSNGANANATWNMGVTAAGAMTGVNTWQQKVLTTAALGATLDFVAATWTKQATIPVVRLNGRVFGQATAF